MILCLHHWVSRMWKVLCIAGLGLVRAVPLAAQPASLPFEQITQDHGLSQGYVNSILQDKQGFMWFGTGDGLNRFDGYDFVVYRHNPFSPGSLSANFINSVVQDHAGQIWVGTQSGGLNVFDPRTGKFTRFQHDPNDPGSISNNMVFGMIEDPAEPGVLWICTNRGLNRLNLDAHTGQAEFIHFFHDPADATSLSCNYLRSIVVGRSGDLWVGSWEGLNVFDRQSRRFKRIDLKNNQITALYRDRHDRIWIGTYSGGLYCFDPDDRQFTHFQNDVHRPASLCSNMVLSILQDQSGLFWIGTGNGLDALDLNTGHFTHYTHDPANPHSLSHNEVLSLWQSPSGALWAGTNTGGVNRFLPAENRFHHISTQSGEGVALSHNSVYSFYESPAEPGVIWIGAGGGALHRLDMDLGTIKPYLLYPQKRELLYSIYIYAITRDPAGRFWIGSTDGFKRFDCGSGEFVHYVHDPGDPGSMSDVELVKSFFLDPEVPEALWVGYDFSGLSRFNTENERFQYFTHDPANPESIGSNEITCMIRRRSGGMWVGTKSGLNRYDIGRNRFIRYVHDPGNPSSLSNSYIKSIFEDDLGVLWVGTYGGGLNKLEWDASDSLSITHYLEEDGLSNNVVYGILADDSGMLWLSTNKGLSRFNPQTEHFRNFDSQDGLQSNEFNTGAYLKTSRGALFFGGINGFNWFHPDSIRGNAHIPPVVFTDFQLFNESVKPGEHSPLRRPVNSVQKIVLNHHQDVFSFQFAALDFVEPEKNQYAYKLEGFEENWNPIGTRRFITFTNLPAGEYMLRVRGSNNAGVWNSEGAAMQICITPPWYETIWASLLFGIIIIGGFVLALRFHLNRERMKDQIALEHLESEKLQEIDRMKSGFFANISHEFRTPLALILGAAESLDKGGEAPDSPARIIRNARRLLGLVNEILDLSKLEAGRLKLNASPGNIIPLLRGLLYAFDTLAKSREIELVFQSNCDPLILNYDAVHMEKVFCNLFSNAVKFTPDGGVIHVHVFADKMAVISVGNSGPGIKHAHLPHLFDRFYQVDDEAASEHRGTGIGLALTRELVRLHGGEIDVESEPGKGAVFTVRLPVSSGAAAEGLRLEGMNRDSVQWPPNCLNSEDREKVEAKASGLPIVLIVEDNEDMRAYIREILEDAYRILEASDGVKGFESAAEAIPDLVISDVMMPRMGGYRLCEKLKHDERTSHIPVILLTAKSSDESKIEGLGLGADDYLIKPFDSTELRVRVKNLIAQRKKLRERFARQMVLHQHDMNVPAPDEAFIARSIELIESRMEDAGLSVELLGSEMGFSRSQFYRKVLALTGKTPSQFISVIRLKFAARLLKTDDITVSEIAFRVGFSSPSYFHKCFRDQYGMTPTEYAAQQ